MPHLGVVKPGSIVYVEFDSYDGSGASVTMTGLATTDIEVYKDGGTTQRGSDNGYTLLDTDGTDFDGVTGIHGLSIDLADNSSAGFWACGSWYRVVIASVTINSQTVTFTAATFRIGYPDAILNTSLATLTNQTSFTLTTGPAQDDALNGCIVLVHAVASAVQMCFGIVNDYTGSTKTVTLAADPGIYTMAASDSIAFFPPVNVKGWSGSAVATVNTAGYPVVTIKDGTGTGEIDTTSGGVLVAAIAANAITASAIAADAITAAKVADGTIDAATFASGAITAAAIATDAIGAAELAADAAAEIAAAVWDLDATAHQTQGTFGQAIGDPVADTGTIFKATVTDATGATVGIDTAAIITTLGAAGAGLSAIPFTNVWSVGTRTLTANTNLNDLSAAGVRSAVGLASANLDTQLGAIDDYIDTEVAAIKAKTDNLPASPAATGDAMTLTSGERNSVADAMLNRDLSTGTDSGSSTVRTVRQALRFLRNKWAVAAGTLTVYKEDDSTSSWTATVSTDASAAPIVGNDPAGP